MKRTMALILAGGEGERLSILSSVRAKPAVPLYQSLPLRPRYGCSMRTPPRIRSRSHGRPMPMCWRSEVGRYWVRMPTS